jgi:hypothetical protein
VALFEKILGDAKTYPVSSTARLEPRRRDVVHPPGAGEGMTKPGPRGSEEGGPEAQLEGLAKEFVEKNRAQCASPLTVGGRTGP